jgi:hypothetical protein
MEELFERAFNRLHKSANSSALETIVRFMLKYRTKLCKSIFDLLTLEKQKAIKAYQQT